jgi:OOP family OmpA-OmpF porin
MRNFGSPVTESDDRSTSWAFKAGYRFHRYFAVEVGYTNLGDFDTTIGQSCFGMQLQICTPIQRMRTSIDGFSVDAIGVLPVSRHVELMGKVGGFHRTASFSLLDVPHGDDFVDRKSTVWKFAIGAGFPMNDRLALSVDAVRYLDVGIARDPSGNHFLADDGDGTVISLGARWNF